MNIRAVSRHSQADARAEAPPIQKGREAFGKQAWGVAFSELMAADREASLGPEDLIKLAQSALLIGKEAEGMAVLARAHQAFLSRGDRQPAVRCAFWLGFTLLIGGEAAQAGGWLSRATRLLNGQPDCAEQGYLLLAQGYRLFHAGDAGGALTAFARAAAIGERFCERDLVALGLQGQGRALIRQGEIVRGVALLDEAMVAVTAGEVSPLNAGGVYCSVLDACGEIFDLQRAQEWTSALEKWCEAQPDVAPYRGHCLIRRAELLQLHGSWVQALEAAQQATEWLSRPNSKSAAGAAFYQVGEILRLRGNFSESAEAYQQASLLYRCCGPGPALLRLAQGRVDAANAMIRRLLDEVRDTGPRSVVLAAYVEIVLAMKDLAAARAAAEELAKIAALRNIPYLNALSSRSSGSVLLAEGNAPAALAQLTRSWSLWCELEAPYEAACVRYAIALAHRALRDEENALQELSAARETFQGLGASADIRRVEALLTNGTGQPAGPLTEREVQVLRLVATGMSNRGIAAKLKISEKTVARHLSNIFTKLDLPSRTAAAAYAYERNLV